MATVFKEVNINASAEVVWAAVRDVGAVHERLVPGFVTAVQLEPGARVVTFANGMIVRELIVDIDEEKRRFAYAAVGGRTTHHNASIQVLARGEERCSLVWTTDLLPDEMEAPIAGMMDQGVEIMKRTLESVTQ